MLNVITTSLPCIRHLVVFPKALFSTFYFSSLTLPLSVLIFSLSLDCHLYVDDIQLFFSFHQLNFDSSIYHLQNALQQSSSWQLPISYSKCCVSSLGKYHSGSVRLFTMNDHNILPVEQVVDLGVSVDREMKFSLHIANISRKAHKRANLIICCFHSKNMQSLVASYKSVCQSDLGVLLCFTESKSHKRYKSSWKRPKMLHKKAPGHGKTNISSASQYARIR